MTNNRMLTIAGVAAIASSTTAAILLAIVLVTRPASPLTYQVPQHVLNGGQVRVGTVVEVEATKCNSTTRSIETVGSHSWRTVDAEGKAYGPAIAATAPGLGTNPPGCSTTHFINHLPVEITAGRWRIEGVEEVLNGTQRLAWYTEPFVVLP